MYMNILIIILGILGTIALAVFGVLYSINNKTAAIWTFCFACICYLVIICIYWQKAVHSLRVFPSNRVIDPGFKEKFLLKIVNSHDTPLYQIELQIKIEEGDLSPREIRLTPKEEAKIESKLGGKHGGIIIGHDIFGIGTIDKDGKEVTSYFIYDIDPNSVKDILVDVNGDNIKQRSKLVFKIVNYSLEHARVTAKDNRQTCSEDDNYESALNKGIRLIDKKIFPEALKCFERAIFLSPKSAIAHTNIGNVYHFMGQNSSAITEFQKAIELDPKLAQPQFNLGVLYLNNNNLDLAIQRFEYAAKLDHQMIKYESLIAWGVCLKKISQQEKAYEKYQSAIDHKPELAPAYHQWGVDLLGQRQFTEAILKFKKVSEIDSAERLDAIGLWGAALENIGKTDEAIEKYKEVIKMAPNSPQAKKSRTSIRKLTNKMKGN